MLMSPTLPRYTEEVNKHTPQHSETKTLPDAIGDPEMLGHLRTIDKGLVEIATTSRNSRCATAGTSPMTTLSKKLAGTSELDSSFCDHLSTKKSPD